MFLEGGRIAEMGTHSELVSRGEEGHYVQMLSFDQSRKERRRKRSEGKELGEEGKDSQEDVDREEGEEEKEEEEEETVEAETKLEEDVENAGWGVMIKYLKVRKRIFRIGNYLIKNVNLC